MRESNWTTSEAEGRHASLAFSATNDRAGIEAEDSGSDWDEARFVGLIERDGFIRTETLAGDWE